MWAGVRIPSKPKYFRLFFSAIAKIVARLRGPWLYFISIRTANEIYFITTYTRRYDVTSVVPKKAYLGKRIRLRY